MKFLKLAPLVIFPLLVAAQQTDLLNTLRFRQIGPFRGGRSVAVAGVPSQPDTYYFGAVGGGVFKTTDSGLTWVPVSDGQFKTGSVGALAVADSDPNVIYAGMGEACVRGNATHGDGVYKSVDAGRTWRNIGLEDSYHIGAVRVHPKNPDVVYVAALGHLWGPNEMRGVYRTTDGGATWKQVLKRNNTAGAVDIAMDPGNPRVLYAALWEISRKPWRMDSGGPASGLFKSTDGGENWTKLGLDATERIARGQRNVLIGGKTRVRELDGIASSVNDLSRALGDQEALRRRLSADIAHELRTPLATLQSHLEALIDGVWQPDAARLGGLDREQ